MTNIKEQTIPTAYSRDVNVESTLKYMGEVITFLAKGTETNGRFALGSLQKTDYQVRHRYQH